MLVVVCGALRHDDVQVLKSDIGTLEDGLLARVHPMATYCDLDAADGKRKAERLTL